MSLNKSENKVQIDHLHSKHIHTVKRLQKLVYEILDKIHQFLPRDATLSAVHAVVVCLSVCVCVCVCVSVTLRYCNKTAKYRSLFTNCRITEITPHNSPLTLVFWHQSSRQNSNGITPYGGDKCRWGGLKFVTFDQKCAITRKRYKIDA